MIEMIKVELTKLRKRKMTSILLGVIVAFYILLYIVHFAVAKSPPDRWPPDIIEANRAGITFPGALDLIFSLAQSIGAMLIVILVGAAVGNEYGWGTIRQMLTRKGTRYQYVLAKLSAYIILVIIGLVIAVVVGVILSMITTAGIEGSIDWSFMNASLVGDMFRNYGWTLFSLIPYVLLTFTFAVLGRSAMVGIGAGLGYVFVEGIAVGLLGLGSETLAKIRYYLIGPNAEALLPSTGMEGPFGSSVAPPSTLWAAITLIIYSAALLGISLLLFKKRDITA